jgi:cyclic beta-1,2-glucan synthetase
MAATPAPLTSGQDLPLTAPTLDMRAGGLPEAPTVSDAELRKRADGLTAQWELVAPSDHSAEFKSRIERLKSRLKQRLQICKANANPQEPSWQFELLENTRMLQAGLVAGTSASAEFGDAPHVRVAGDEESARVFVLAEHYLSAAEGIWSPASLRAYMQQVQLKAPLLLAEIDLLPQALRLAQTEFILDRADEAVPEASFSAIIHGLRRMSQYEWNQDLEHLVAFDPILRADPVQAFAAMDDESRRSYQRRVAYLAEHSDFGEVEVAQAALDLAREASRLPHNDPRYFRRLTHIGYYLFAEGLSLLHRRIGYYPPGMERVRDFLRRWRDDFYIFGTHALSLLLLVAIIGPLVPHYSYWPLMFAFLLALIPVSQGGVDLMNHIVSALFGAEALPKFDYSEGIPADVATFVVVPTLLIHEKQVRDLCEELEARYLSNQDPNIHFGLLTDLPDAPVQPNAEDRSPLVDLAAQSINDLNEKYRGQRGGSFLLLHRHRVFNARQGVWMGWERKRGKLLDFTKLLLKTYDSFPVKAGPLDVLNRVRYVITLDSDTQLPHGTAAKMIGTMAHPLNQAIVDPHLRIVAAGYGILQPRVGVSVASAARSHLSSLYSGETGFDIYTRAVSDVYQDLFGEGIFTGKGIYEVSIFHQVLDRRFPRNALLSHDLIEGSYLRAGLVTDIEVIDDYPSHYSAHSRRKHRWMRGDWQITQWLFSRVPDESGRMVPNPISTISRWKIFDNLRRSLVEPLTFLVFLLGWFVLPGGAVYWTAAACLLLFLPGLVQFAFGFVQALLKLSIAGMRGSFLALAGSIGITLLNLSFLPHHMLLSLDAIFRTLARTLVSGRRMLEWETAAQSESRTSRTPLDYYLQLSPFVAVAIAAGLAFKDLRSLYAAAPILLLWLFAPLTAKWLDAPLRQEEGPVQGADRNFLQRQACLVWRYFLDFGDETNHWLIPDNVEEKNTHQTRKLSPTNYGLLLNARQAALEMGWLTLPEFARATLGSLATYDRLEKSHGHIYNWYDIETLKPIAPLTISTVDSGNLAASLYTLHGGALELLQRPVLSEEAFAGLDLAPGKHEPSPSVPEEAEFAASASALRELMRAKLDRNGQADPSCDKSPWMNGSSPKDHNAPPEDSEAWLASEAACRREALGYFVQSYLPWLLPRFETLFTQTPLNEDLDRQVPALQTAVEYIRGLQSRIQKCVASLPQGSPVAVLASDLQSLLPGAQHRLAQLKTDVVTIASQAERHADEMDFSFLYVRSRRLLSIGYDAPTREVHSACYDLLASEARLGCFLAVAKKDVPQQSWFRLDRSHVLVDGRPSLLSWTGTMFEYMMPSLWMRSYPNTLIARALEAAVRIQKDHVRDMPWGISESGFAKTDALGRYGYQAWGIPALALKYEAEDGPVVSPYSTFLALSMLRSEAISNLRKMAALGWEGPYGFYEAADYTQGKRPELVRSWMAHHHGMSLLAIVNLLRGNVFQRWFHANPRVRATELLLHEKPLSRDTLRELARQPKPGGREAKADSAPQATAS